jgi:hypothetical protein
MQLLMVDQNGFHPLDAASHHHGLALEDFKDPDSVPHTYDEAND